MENLSQEDLCWVAGILEGEGCFQLIKSKLNGKKGGFGYRIYAGLTMTDKDVVDKIAKKVGCGVLYKDSKRGNRKQPYSWRIGKRRDVVPFLKKIRPLMGERRGNKIDEILKINEQNPPLRLERGSFVHGYRSTYAKGCRCEMCRIAESSYRYNYRKNKIKC